MATTDLSGLNYATVTDGKVYNIDGTVLTSKTDSTTSSISAATEDGTNLGYDDFLTLLCAEMQYQDPLEPTSNTEYVAQLATFSQLESTLSMQDTLTSIQESLENSLSTQQQLMQSNNASALVGKYVIINTTDDDGNQTYVSGKVDYVMYDTDGSVLVSVADGLYPYDEIDTIADADYYDAVSMSKTFENMLSQLPVVDDLTADYASAVSQIRDLYDGMTSYQQGYISSSDLSKLEAYEAKIALLTDTEEETDTESSTEAAEETAAATTATDTAVSEETVETAATEEAAETASA
jgi:flagellar basal-body rod modification protein FlgD